MKPTPRLQQALEEVAAATAAMAHGMWGGENKPEGWSIRMIGSYDTGPCPDGSPGFFVMAFDVPVLIDGRTPTPDELVAKSIT